MRLGKAVYIVKFRPNQHEKLGTVGYVSLKTSVKMKGPLEQTVATCRWIFEQIPLMKISVCLTEIRYPFIHLAEETHYGANVLSRFQEN